MVGSFVVLDVACGSPRSTAGILCKVRPCDHLPANMAHTQVIILLCCVLCVLLMLLL